MEVDETFFLERQKSNRNLDRKVRKRGGKASKRGLSSGQVPVLVAVNRSGTTASTVLPAVNSEALKSAIEPVVTPDILLVSDGNNAYPPCAAALGVRHEAFNLSKGERVRGTIHSQTVNNRHSRLKAFTGRATMAFQPNTYKIEVFVLATPNRPHLGTVPTLDENHRVAVARGLSGLTNARCRTLSTHARGSAAQSLQNGLHPERSRSRSCSAGMSM